MQPAKKEIPYRARLALYPDGLTLTQAHVPKALHRAAQKEWKARKLSMRQVLVWCLSNFLLATNPKAAAELGIYERRLHKKSLPPEI